MSLVLDDKYVYLKYLNSTDIDKLYNMYLNCVKTGNEAYFGDIDVYDVSYTVYKNNRNKNEVHIFDVMINDAIKITINLSDYTVELPTSMSEEFSHDKYFHLSDKKLTKRELDDVVANYKLLLTI